MGPITSDNLDFETARENPTICEPAVREFALEKTSDSDSCLVTQRRTNGTRAEETDKPEEEDGRSKGEKCQEIGKAIPVKQELKWLNIVMITTFHILAFYSLFTVSYFRDMRTFFWGEL